MSTIPQKELRNNVGEVLRRAEAGEQITITVAGRPVAELGPTRQRQWVSGDALRRVWATPPPRSAAADLAKFPGGLDDPFEQRVQVVLDTSVLMGDEAPTEVEAAISTASLAELHFGVLIADNDEERARRTQRLGVIESTFAALPITGEVAREWGQLAAAVSNRGGQPRRRAIDLAIAATANVYDVPLLTHDKSDLQIIRDLIDAREPSEFDSQR